MRKRWEGRVFPILLTVGMILFCITTIYPFLHVLALSLNHAADAELGGITIWPRRWSLDSYITVFGYDTIYKAFTMSVLRTVVGTVSSLLCTTMLAYSLTKKQLLGYKYIYGLFIVTMFVGGGLIPTFMLYRSLGIFNSFWVYVLPGLVNAFNMILFRTFFMQLPQSLEESAIIDGANELQIYIRIILPLSAPILATIGLFIAVEHWNAWHDTLYFTSNPDLETLQFTLMKIIRQAEATRVVKAAKMAMRRKGAVSITPRSVRMAITMVATVPILCVYPFLQKYFVKGILLGAIKG